MKYEVLTETDDLYRFESERRLSTEEVAERLGVTTDELVQIDFWDNDEEVQGYDKSKSN